MKQKARPQHHTRTLPDAGRRGCRRTHPEIVDPAPVQKMIVDPEIAQSVADDSGCGDNEQPNALPVMPRNIVPANSNEGAHRECIEVAKRVRVYRKRAI